MPDTPPMPPTRPPESGLGDGAAITPDDIERARLRFRAVAPAEFKNLLDAQPEPPKDTP